MQYGWLLRLMAGGLLAYFVAEIILLPYVHSMVKVRRKA